MRGGQKIVEDPGTGLYTADPDLRNRLRQTRAHNTVELAGQEQNRFVDGGLFTLRQDVTQFGGTLTQTPSGFSFSGWHNGYTRLGESLVHVRNIEFDEIAGSMSIEDLIDGDVDALASLLIPVDCRFDGTRFLSPQMWLSFGDDAAVSIEPATYSKAYGEVETTGFVYARASFSRRLVTTLRFDLALDEANQLPPQP